MKIQKFSAALALLTLVSQLFASQALAADLEIVINDLRPNKGGQIVVGVFDSEENFPKTANPDLSQIVPPNKAGRFIIKGVPAGEYAVAIFHDENVNGKIDGFPPNEGYAFSNDARGTFGPPSYEKAKFTVREPGSRISIRMRY